MTRDTSFIPLALFLLPSCSDWYSTSLRKDCADILALEDALVEFAALNAGRYPDSLEVLAVPDENGHLLINRERLPLDPWGNAYGYEPPAAEGGLPRIFCYGSDGKLGGKGKARDVDNFMIRAGRG